MPFPFPPAVGRCFARIILYCSFLVSRYSRFWGKSNHLVYVGDARIHQLFQATRSDLRVKHAFDINWVG